MTAPNTFAHDALVKRSIAECLPAEVRRLHDDPPGRAVAATGSQGRSLRQVRTGGYPTDSQSLADLTSFDVRGVCLLRAVTTSGAKRAHRLRAQGRRQARSACSAPTGGANFGAADGQWKTIRAVRTCDDGRETTMPHLLMGAGASHAKQVESELGNAVNRAPSVASDLITADLAPRANSAVWRNATAAEDEAALEYIEQRRAL